MRKKNIFFFSLLLLFASCRSSESLKKPVEDSPTSVLQQTSSPQTPAAQPTSLPSNIPSVETKPFNPSPVKVMEDKPETPSTEVKSPWPPEGPYCRNFVDCCEAAQKIRGKVSMLCLSIASRQPVDCEKALQEVVGFLKNLNLAIPRYCE